MIYEGKTLNEAIKNAAEAEYCSEEEIEYLLLEEDDEHAKIEVFI